MPTNASCTASAPSCSSPVMATATRRKAGYRCRYVRSISASNSSRFLAIPFKTATSRVFFSEARGPSAESGVVHRQTRPYTRIRANLPEVRGREPSAIPPLRVLRDTAGGGTTRAGDAEDGHDRLLRPEGLDEPRRGARLRVAPRGDDALLRGDAGDPRGAGRPRREVHRRRDHGRLRPASDPRGRRAPG